MYIHMYIHRWAFGCHEPSCSGFGVCGDHGLQAEAWKGSGIKDPKPYGSMYVYYLL